MKDFCRREKFVRLIGATELAEQKGIVCADRYTAIAAASQRLTPSAARN